VADKPVAALAGDNKTGAAMDTVVKLFSAERSPLFTGDTVSSSP
jgi:hypothetical protein